MEGDNERCDCMNVGAGESIPVSSSGAGVVILEMYNIHLEVIRSHCQAEPCLDEGGNLSVATKGHEINQSLSLAGRKSKSTCKESYIVIHHLSELSGPETRNVKNPEPKPKP